MSLTLADFHQARRNGDQATFDRYLAQQHQAGRPLAEGVLWEALEEAIQANQVRQVTALLPRATYPRQDANRGRVLHALNAALGAGGRPAQPPGPHHRRWAEALFRLCPPEHVAPLYDPTIGHTVSNPVVIERSMVAHALRWELEDWVEEVWAQGVTQDTRWHLLAAALHPTVGRPAWIPRLLLEQDPREALDHLGRALPIRPTTRTYRYHAELARLLTHLPQSVADTWLAAYPHPALLGPIHAVIRATRRQADLDLRPSPPVSTVRHRV